MSALEMARQKLVNKVITGFHDDMQEYFDSSEVVIGNIDGFVSQFHETGILSVLPDTGSRFEFDHSSVDLIAEVCTMTMSIDHSLTSCHHYQSGSH